MRNRSILLGYMCLWCLASNSMYAQQNKTPFNTIGEVSSNPVVRVASPVMDAEADTIPDEQEIEEPMDSIRDSVPLMVSLPLKEIHVNSPFGIRRDPMNRNKSRMHNGLDLRARFEDVYSMLPGTVTAASYSTSGGYYVTVDHGVCSTSYLHLSKISVVNGQHVKAGDKIAVSGNTGKRTTGPHLHLACKWSDTGRFFDPRILLRFVTQELVKMAKPK